MQCPVEIIRLETKLVLQQDKNLKYTVDEIKMHSLYKEAAAVFTCSCGPRPTTNLKRSLQKNMENIPVDENLKARVLEGKKMHRVNKLNSEKTTTYI